MKLYKIKDILNSENYAIKKLKIPGIVLMEHAARSVLEEIEKEYGLNHKFIVVYGPGNNGGDALALSRMLFLKNANIKIYSALGSPKTKEAKQELSIVKKLKIKEIKNDILKSIDSKTIVIDGVFGIGFNKEIPTKLIKLFESFKKAKAVVSIDVPSGLNIDNGELSKGAVISNLTVSFILPKLGLYTSPGAINAGKVVTKDIFTKDLQIKTNYELIDKDLINSIFKKLKRKNNTHKGSFGHVGVVKGDMNGAAILSTKAALSVGAGLVSIILDNKISKDIKTVKNLDDEVMVKSDLSSFDVIVIGPGLGTGKDKELFLSKVLELAKTNKTKILIDADAINIISKNKKLIKKLNKNCILTPHPGEFSRLVNIPNNLIQEKRLSVLENFMKDKNFTIVLKGFRSLINSNNFTYINNTGGPHLSKAGTGDVLSGIIASLWAQGLSSTEASILGVYLHGLTADRLLEEKSELSIKASDIILKLEEVLKCI
jgi:NAD(P)H-hydrate epimerase